jgi:hypothetical protein
MSEALRVVVEVPNLCANCGEVSPAEIAFPIKTGDRVACQKCHTLSAFTVETSHQRVMRVQAHLGMEALIDSLNLQSNSRSAFGARIPQAPLPTRKVKS